MFSTFLGRTTVASTSAQELRGVVHIALERLPEVANNNLALFSERSLLMFLHRQRHITIWSRRPCCVAARPGNALCRVTTDRAGTRPVSGYYLDTGLALFTISLFTVTDLLSVPFSTVLYSSTGTSGETKCSNKPTIA